MIVKDKQEALELYWLQLATEKDGIHPTLQCVHFTEKKTEAADGFRAHIVKKQLGKPGTFKLNHGKPLYKTPREIETREDEGRFPDVDRITPEGEPMLAFGIDRHLLMEALTMPNETGYVMIKIYGQCKPIIVEDAPEKGKESMYKAVIMPVHLGKL